jgi:hypothetical protein
LEAAGDQAQSSHQEHQQNDGVEEAHWPEEDMQVGDDTSEYE